MPTTDAPSPNRWLQSTMDSRRRRRDAARARLRRLRGRTAVGALVAAMTLASGVALAHERPRERAAQPSTTGGQSLKYGARGTAVASVQRRLGLTPDGVFGPATERAVKRFQRRRGLTADGIVGPATASALNVALPARSQRVDRSLTGTTRGNQALLERIARCESGGDPRAVSPDGRYRGKYQFSRATWRALGGTGDPAKAPEAEQDRLAAALLAQSGTSPWPNCA